jgi:hypothetical protein
MSTSSLTIVAITTAVAGKEQALRAAQEKIGSRNRERARLSPLRTESVSGRRACADLHREMGKRTRLALSYGGGRDASFPCQWREQIDRSLFLVPHGNRCRWRSSLAVPKG